MKDRFSEERYDDDYVRYRITVLVRPKGTEPEYEEGFEGDIMFDKHAFYKEFVVSAPTPDDAEFVVEYEIQKEGRYEFIAFLDLEECEEDRE